MVQPGNIFVKNGQYKLGDFGLVTPVHVRSGTDVVEGDSRYMSKELLNDDHSNLTKVPTLSVDSSRGSFYVDFFSFRRVFDGVREGCLGLGCRGCGFSRIVSFVCFWA